MLNTDAILNAYNVLIAKEERFQTTLSDNVDHDNLRYYSNGVILGLLLAKQTLIELREAKNREVYNSVEL